jgi:hypothetical protein
VGVAVDAGTAMVMVTVTASAVKLESRDTVLFGGEVHGEIALDMFGHASTRQSNLSAWDDIDSDSDNRVGIWAPHNH